MTSLIIPTHSREEERERPQPPSAAWLLGCSRRLHSAAHWWRERGRAWRVDSPCTSGPAPESSRGRRISNCTQRTRDAALCCAALSIAADWLFLDVSLPYHRHGRHGLPLMSTSSTTTLNSNSYHIVSRGGTPMNTFDPHVSARKCAAALIRWSESTRPLERVGERWRMGSCVHRKTTSRYSPPCW